MSREAAPALAHNERLVLVVDDDALVLRSIQRVLERAGYSVVTAGDVSEALTVAGHTPFDAAIVDYTLARESGLTVLAKLRELQPHCVRILCTGRRELPILVEAVNTGEVARVVQKPFQVGQLLAQLEDALASAAQLERYTTDRQRASFDVERQTLEQALQQPLIGIALQPIVQRDPTSITTLYYEALLRPKHPGLPSPLALLSAAERHGRATDAGTLALRCALARIHDLPAQSGLFVNLHPEQLGQPDRLEAELLPYLDHAHRITLEITEQSRIHDIPCWDVALARTTAHGFSIAVDDLGAGYSSLSMLADLQPQFIKLDMSLVRSVHNEPRKQRLVQLMATFGNATDARVIAEGVETAEEAQALADCGIDLMQGYHFGRPSEDKPQ